MWHSINHQGFNVAVVGATGAVGDILLSLLQGRRFPVRALKLLASERSTGVRLRFADRVVPVERATPDALAGSDLVFFAATGELSRSLAPKAASAGAVVIDKSNTWRMDPKVPLVVPEINAKALAEHRGIIACPNCTTTGLVMALEPIRRVAGLRRVTVTTLQAISGSGKAALDEYDQQQEQQRQGQPLSANVYPKPILGNVIPLCETIAQDDYSTEEHKLRNETRKILNLPGLSLAMTAVRVPVRVGHSASVLIETESPLSAGDARAALSLFSGVRLLRDELPTPLDVAGQDDVVVGRVRQDLDSNALWLWEVSDNLRKGAATNAVQIAETLIEQRLIQR